MGGTLAGTQGTSSAISFYGEKRVNVGEAGLQSRGLPRWPDFEVHVHSLHHVASIVTGRREREVFFSDGIFFFFKYKSYTLLSQMQWDGRLENMRQVQMIGSFGASSVRWFPGQRLVQVFRAL